MKCIACMRITIKIKGLISVAISIYSSILGQPYDRNSMVLQMLKLKTCIHKI